MNTCTMLGKLLPIRTRPDVDSFIIALEIWKKDCFLSLLDVPYKATDTRLKWCEADTATYFFRTDIEHFHRHSPTPPQFQWSVAQFVEISISSFWELLPGFQHRCWRTVSYGKLVAGRLYLPRTGGFITIEKSVNTLTWGVSFRTCLSAGWSWLCKKTKSFIRWLRRSTAVRMKRASMRDVRASRVFSPLVVSFTKSQHILSQHWWARHMRNSSDTPNSFIL